MSKLNKCESKTLLFSGSKGGCGSSFISYCISTYLAKSISKNIVLLDLNIGKKDSRIIFDISGDNLRDFGDIEDVICKMDVPVLKRLVVNFDNSLNVILPPLKLEKNKIFYNSNLETFLDVLKNYFDIICIDFPCYLFTLKKLDFLKDIDKFIIISQPDIISISNLDILLDSISGMDYSYSFDIVINKFNVRPAISFSKINNFVRHPIKAFIPYDRDIEFLFLNKGPFSIFNYNLRIVRNIIDYSNKLYESLDYGN